LREALRKVRKWNNSAHFIEKSKIILPLHTLF
jgi:hypothetical protein